MVNHQHVWTKVMFSQRCCEGSSFCQAGSNFSSRIHLEVPAQNMAAADISFVSAISRGQDKVTQLFSFQMQNCILLCYREYTRIGTKNIGKKHILLLNADWVKQPITFYKIYSVNAFSTSWNNGNPISSSEAVTMLIYMTEIIYKDFSKKRASILLLWLMSQKW